MSGAYEYNIIVTGSSVRKTVNLQLFAAGKLMSFERDLFNGAWFGDWRGDGVDSQGTGYIRYNNGIQICWDVITSDGATHTSESWGGGTIHAEIFSPIKPFPQSFISYPSLTCTREYSGTAILFLGIDFTPNGISIIRNWRPDAEYYGFGYLDYIAIGRWK